MISPVPNVVPTGGFVGMVVGPRLRTEEHREAVMLWVRAKEANGALAVVFEHVVRDEEAQLHLVEAKHWRQIAGRDHHMLQAAREFGGG